MKRTSKKQILAIFILAALVVLFSGCNLFQKPEQKPDDEQTVNNPWEDLPIISNDGSGVITKDGGVVWLNDLVGVEIGRYQLEEGENVNVSISVENVNKEDILNANEELLASSNSEWGNKQIVVEISRNDIQARVVLGEDADFYSFADGKVLDVLLLNDEYQAYSVTNITDNRISIPSKGTIEPSEQYLVIAKWRLVFRSSILESIASDCESSGGTFYSALMDDWQYEDPSPTLMGLYSIVTYICIPPLGYVWQPLDYKMVEKNWPPASKFDKPTILTANVGNTFGNSSVEGFKYKLAKADVAQRIANNISIIKPDIIAIQEVHNEKQVRQLINTKYYNYTCAEYQSGDSYECVAWRKDRININEESQKKTIWGKEIPLEMSFGTYVRADREIHISLGDDYCNKSDGGKDSGAVIVPLVFSDTGITIDVGSIHTATAGVESDELCREQQLLTILQNADVAYFDPPKWNTNSATRLLLAGDFNIDPERGGVSRLKADELPLTTVTDRDRLRWLVEWSGVPEVHDEPENIWDLIFPKDLNAFIPLRSENDQTSPPLLDKSLDHILATKSTVKNSYCEVLKYQYRLDSNYWWGYDSSSGSYVADGMDHRAVICGFEFFPYYEMYIFDSSISVVQGVATDVSATVEPKAGFVGEVMFIVESADGSPLPDGLTTIYPPVSFTITDPSRSESIAIPIGARSDASPGIYKLRIRAVGGEIERTANFTLEVTAADSSDFTLSLDPDTLTVTQGKSATTTLTVTPQNGFTGQIDFTLEQQDGSPAPDGITLSPPDTTINSTDPKPVEMVISTTTGVAPGNYNLQIKAVSGDLVRYAPLTVEVVSADVGDVNETAWGLVTGHISDVIYVNGEYIAVGSMGTIFHSYDGNTWERQTLIPNYGLGGIAYGDIFVVVGDGGTIMISEDGDNWLSVESPYDGRLLDIAYGDDKYVAVGYDGAIITSRDGRSWVLEDSGTSDILHDVAYGDGIFVAVSESGKALVSSDGANWTEYSTGTTYRLDSIVFGDDGFVAVGYWGVIVGSHDGMNWDSRGSAGMTLYGVGYGNGTYVAVGWGGRIYTSTDAESWSESMPGPSSAETLACVGYGDGEFIALGEGSRTLVSPDGYEWNEVYGASIKYWDAAVGANGGIAVVGESGNIVVMQEDGSNVTRQTSNTTATLYGISFIGDSYFAVGASGTIITAADDSSFGLVWENKISNTSADLWDIAYGNGKYVVVGDSDTVVTSSDALTWSTTSTGAGVSLRAVAFGAGKFVAAGANGVIVTSDNGEEWVAADATTSNGIYDIVYTGDKFVAVGSQGTILTSQDGVDWYVRSLDTSEDLYGVAYGDGVLVAVGGPYVAPGVIATSHDGELWNVLDTIAPRQLLGITYARGRFTAVGNWGEIIQSQ